MLFLAGPLGKIESYLGMHLPLLIVIFELILLIFLIAVLVSLKNTRKEVFNIINDINKIKEEFEKSAFEKFPEDNSADREKEDDPKVYDEIMSFSKKNGPDKEEKDEEKIRTKVRSEAEAETEAETEAEAKVKAEDVAKAKAGAKAVAETEVEAKAVSENETEKNGSNDLDYALSHMEAGSLKVHAFFEKVEQDKDYPATVLACRLRGITAAEYYLKMRNIFTREAVWLTPREDQLILVFIKNDKKRVMEFVWKHIVYQEEVSAYKLFDVSEDHDSIEVEKEAEEFLRE